jgi:NADPH:quinone reductase-like Zn-dependent oxidoreductase
MKALVLHAHGGNDQLQLHGDWPDPVPGPDDVLLRVRACSLNYHDVFTRRGMPGIRLTLPLIMGIDVAGEIVALGESVSGWHVGQRVLVDPSDVEHGLLGEGFDGGLAELVRVPARMLLPLPDDVDFATAASLPVAYGTAFRMMRVRGRIQSGERVLILGASGGVGTCCVQLAAAAGCETAVVASTPDKLERLHQLGARHGFLHADGQWPKAVRELFGKASAAGPGPGGVDVVVNFTGGDTWVPSLRVLKHGGRLLTCGATAGFDPKEDIRYIWTFELNILGSNGWLREDLHALLSLVRGQGLVPVLHPRRFTLADAPGALTLLEERAVTGKLIIEP